MEPPAIRSQWLRPLKKSEAMVAPDFISTGTAPFGVLITKSTSFPLWSRQKASWVLNGELALVRGFKRYVAVLRKGAAQQRGLARLARPSERRDGVLLARPNESGG